MTFGLSFLSHKHNFLLRSNPFSVLSGADLSPRKVTTNRFAATLKQRDTRYETRLLRYCSPIAIKQSLNPNSDRSQAEIYNSWSFGLLNFLSLLFPFHFPYGLCVLPPRDALCCYPQGTVWHAFAPRVARPTPSACVCVSQTTWLQKRKKLNPNLATSKQLCCCIFIYFYLRVVFLYFPWPLEHKESLQTVGIWTVHGKKLALGHVLDVPRN